MKLEENRKARKEQIYRMYQVRFFMHQFMHHNVSLKLYFEVQQRILELSGIITKTSKTKKDTCLCTRKMAASMDKKVTALLKKY